MKQSRYACYMCEKTFKVKENFEMHLETHVKKEEEEDNGEF